VLYSALNTLNTLDVVEADRDRWQRPADILEALDVREGNVVVDLGSGAGYFALKLSPIIGSRGKVLAIDIRKLPLCFLWIRSALRHSRNIHVILGDQDNPHLPSQAVDAVLVANTYHEFRNPRVVLDHVFRSLRSRGKLVIVDRGPRLGETASPHEVARGHERSRSDVEQELREKGFEIVCHEDPFIDRAGDDPWWLIIARKRQSTSSAGSRKRSSYPGVWDQRIPKFRDFDAGRRCE
jgi:ubiquinone/menaquinone biosynthesis C-methylase UbiE